jgi:RNA polymerase sigma-B factor
MTAAVTRLRGKMSAGAELTDPELVELVQSLPAGSPERDAACEKLVSRYQSLVRSCAQRYRQSPEPQEELMQVGYVGLMKAINNFDPSLGFSLSAYAQPCVSGEIKRHFRDKRWLLHVKRPAQELRLELRQARADLTQQLARTPRDEELASHLGITAEELVDAQRAELAFRAYSLDAPLADGQDSANLADLFGSEDSELEHGLDMDAVWAHWDGLPPRQQHLLLMRFYGNMTQAEIGERLGISQMHVSRLLASALSYLRRCLLEPDEDAGAGGRAG